MLCPDLLAGHIRETIIDPLMEGFRGPSVRLCRCRPLPGRSLAAEAGLSSDGNLPPWTERSASGDDFRKFHLQHTIPSPFPDSSLCGCRGPLPRLAATALWLSRHLLLQHVEEPEAKPMQPTQLLVTTASKASATRRSQNAPQPQRPDLKENTGKACVCGCQSVWAAPLQVLAHPRGPLQAKGPARKGLGFVPAQS